MGVELTRMNELDLRGRRVLIREDLNAPVRDGRVTSSQRLEAALPTLRAALDAGAAVLVLAHRGRPAEGEYDEAYSLAPVASRLSELLGREVPLVRDWIDGVDVEPGDIVLCENVRFEKGEKANDPELAKRMAALCDVFVMDAFGTAHRAQASTVGVAEHAKAVAAGPLLVAELEALTKALEHPSRPFVAIVGGAKVSSKLEVLRVLAAKVDALIVGGGIANTLLAAKGWPVGKSLVEAELADFARRLVAGEFGEAAIPLPSDVAVAPGPDEGAKRRVVRIEDVGENDMILDVGPDTAAAFTERVRGAGTIVWNGPLGVFEHAEFAYGTEQIARAVAASDAFSIAGGGDTLAAVEQFGVGERISYISTGGGAFLEFLEGKELPAVAVLAERRRTRT